MDAKSLLKFWNSWHRNGGIGSSGTCRLSSRNRCEKSADSMANETPPFIASVSIQSFNKGTDEFSDPEMRRFLQVQENRRHCAGAYSSTQHTQFQTCHAKGVIDPDLF